MRPSARWRGCCATAVRRAVYRGPRTSLRAAADGPSVSRRDPPPPAPVRLSLARPRWLGQFPRSADWLYGNPPPHLNSVEPNPLTGCRPASARANSVSDRPQLEGALRLTRPAGQPLHLWHDAPLDRDVLALALIWGASFMFIKVAVREIDPLALVWLRVLLAAVVLVPAALVVVGRRGLRESRAAAGRLRAARLDELGASVLPHLVGGDPHRLGSRGDSSRRRHRSSRS